MTEQEWLASDDPARMLRMVDGSVINGVKASDRKLRLFACACVRQVWHLLTDERSRKAVEMAEKFADGKATADESGAASRLAIEGESGSNYLAFLASGAAADLPTQGLHNLKAIRCEDYFPPSAQAALLREIVGNPFRPVALPAATGVRYWIPWLTRDVLSLAQAAYDDRPGRKETYHLAGVPCHRTIDDGTLNPDRLLVLADALEEAGCLSEVLLRHLRGQEEWVDVNHDVGVIRRHQPGPHVRGCWALDLILGKG